MIFSRKSQVPSNCAQNLVSGVMLCLAQIPKHFHVKPNIHDELFVDQASNLKQLVDLLIFSSESLDYAAQHLATATRDLVETGEFNLSLSLSADFAGTLIRERYIDPFVTVRFFHGCLRGPNGHHVKTLLDNDGFLLSAAKYVLQRVSIQQHNMLKSKQELSIQLLSIERNIFSVADANSLWMKLDESSKLVEEKLDRVEGKIDRLRSNAPTKKAGYAKYTIGIKTAASIVGTSESTFRRRLQENEELRELMRQPNVAVCQAAVSRWWGRFVTGSKVKRRETRSMNRPSLGFVKN